MPTPIHIDALEKRRERLLAALSAIGDLRPGSLTERYRRCGKPTCHCATEDAAGHGPSFSLSRQVHGKTVTRIIPAAAVARTRAQIAECQRFRRLCSEIIEVSERLCDARLKRNQAASATATAEKGGSKTRSKRKSRPRSRH